MTVEENKYKYDHDNQYIMVVKAKYTHTITNDFKTYQCKQCGHEWIPRVKRPIACPKCHSNRWDKENKKDKISSIKIGNRELKDLGTYTDV